MKIEVRYCVVNKRKEKKELYWEEIRVINGYKISLHESLAPAPNHIEIETNLRPVEDCLKTA